MIARLIRWSIANRGMVLLAALALAIAGTLSTMRIPPGFDASQGHDHTDTRYRRRQLPWSAADAETRSPDVAAVLRYTTARAPRAGAIETPR